MSRDGDGARRPPALVCLGLGYTAKALARLMEGRGFAIAGTSRTQAGVDAIASRGWQGVLWAGEELSPALADAVRGATHLLVSVAPGAAGDPVLKALEALAAERHGDRLGLSWIGYLSTVGVYGDCGGAWVDETQPTAATSERARRRVLAEEAWAAFGVRTGLRVEVFRLPGIYGPGRSTLDALRAGTAKRVVREGQVFNRMHVDDIAGALAAAIGSPPRHSLYNVCDDEPAPPQDVVTYAAGLLGIEPPPLVRFEDATLSTMAASFYSESKRVSNARMKAALGYTLRYPTYREGLAALARVDR